MRTANLSVYQLTEKKKSWYVQACNFPASQMCSGKSFNIKYLKPKAGTIREKTYVLIFSLYEQNCHCSAQNYRAGEKEHNGSRPPSRRWTHGLHLSPKPAHKHQLCRSSHLNPLSFLQLRRNHENVKNLSTQKNLTLLNAISVSLWKSGEQILCCLLSTHTLWLDAALPAGPLPRGFRSLLVLWLIEPRQGTIGFHRIQDSLCPHVKYPACLLAPAHDTSQVGSAF